MFMLSAHVNPIYSLKIVENIANLFIILEHSLCITCKGSLIVSNFLSRISILQKIQHFSRQLELNSMLKVLNTLWNFDQSRLHLPVELKSLILILCDLLLLHCKNKLYIAVGARPFVTLYVSSASC